MVDADRIVDFHSHILPRLDHGSDSVETTRFQLRLAEKCGINKIIATSHFYPNEHSLDQFIKKRENAYRALLESCGGRVDVRLGAEVLLCNGLDHLSGLENLCIFGTKYLLLELPFTSYCEEYTATIFRLMDSGYKVILAHADRYPKNLIDKLLTYGVKLQLNANSLVGFNRLKNKHLLKWISKGFVVALGSDIHGRNSQAYAKLRRAYKLTSQVSNVIVNESFKIFSESEKF